MNLEELPVLKTIERPASGHKPARASLQRPGAIAAVNPAAWQIAVWAMLTLGAALIAILNFHNYQIGAYTDDADYIILARSLLESDRYGLINVPGEPASTQFPFGYPLLLAPFVAIFGGAVDPLRAISLAATLTNSALLFWFWPRLTRNPSYSWALAVIALYLFSPLVSTHARMVMSEAIFATFCLIAILLAEKIAAGPASLVDRLVLGVVLFFALFTRTVGFVLVGSVFLYLLVLRRSKAIQDLAITSLGMLALLLGVVVLTPVSGADIIPIRYLTSNDSFLIREIASVFNLTPAAPPAEALTEEIPPSWIEETEGITALDYLGENLREHLGSDLRQIVLPYGLDKGTALGVKLGIPRLVYGVGFIVFLVIALGFITLTQKYGLTLFLQFALVYFGIIFLWVWNGGRLLYPIIPQILYTFLFGLRILVGWAASILKVQRPERLATGIFIVCLGVLFLPSLIKSSAGDDTRHHVGDLESRTAWAAANLPEDSVLLTEAPVVDFYYGAHRTIHYPLWASSQQKLFDYLDRSGATHILVTPKLKWQKSYTAVFSDLTEHILPWLETLAEQGRLSEMYRDESGRVRVYAILP